MVYLKECLLWLTGFLGSSWWLLLVCPLRTQEKFLEIFPELLWKNSDTRKVVIGIVESVKKEEATLPAGTSSLLTLDQVFFTFYKHFGSYLFTTLNWAGFDHSFLILVTFRCEQDRIALLSVTEKWVFIFFWRSVSQWIHIFNVWKTNKLWFKDIHQPVVHKYIYVTFACKWSEDRAVNW